MDMSMHSAVPDWLTPVAWTFIALSLFSSTVIASDIYLLRRRQGSLATELMWITSALYLGPFGLAAYLPHRGAARPPAIVSTVVAGRAESRAVAVLPGGGASAVAHLIAVPIVAAVGWTIDGLAMWMLLLHYNDLMPPVTEGSFWFLMQTGVIIGLLTGYPAISWLRRRTQSATLA